MKTLIITAQPSSEGFVHEIASQYAGTKKTKGIDIEIVDLYAPEYAQEFLKFEDINLMPQDLVKDLFHEKIQNADELVFVFPIWWGDAPAILKNWIDVNLSSDFAFRFKKNGMPEGLLKGKTAKIIATSGAPKFLYWWWGYPYKKIWKKGTLEFCGLKVTDTLHIGGITNKVTRDTKDSVLQKITKLALK